MTRAIATLFGVLLLACGDDPATFDPMGTEVSLAVTWSVKGEDPFPASCSEVGVTRVRLDLYEAMEGGTAYTDDSMSALCPAGSIDLGNTFSPGTYYLAFVGIDRDGMEINESERMEMMVESGGTIRGFFNFRGTEGFDPELGGIRTLEGSWRVNGEAASADVCASGDVETVVLRLMTSDQSFGVDYAYACAEGGFDWRESEAPRIRNEQFTYRWTAISASGEVKGETEAFALDLRETEHEALVSPQFTTVVP